MSPRDRRFALTVAGVVTVVALLPAVIGWVAAPEGMTYTGIHVNSPVDYPVYYANIRYAEEGHLLMADLFTSEATREYPNLFWTAWGLAASPFDLDPRIVFQVARLLTIPLGVLGWAWALRFWLPDPRRWRWGLGLLTFAGGLGLWLVFAQNVAGTTITEGTYAMDVWVSEGFNGLTVLHSPHMVASSTLLLLALTLLARSMAGGRARDAVLAGACVSVLGLFHPFHLVTLAAVPLTAFLAVGLRERRLPWGVLGRFLRYGAAALPGAAVYATLVLTDPTTQQRFSQNLTTTTQLPVTLVSYGLLVPFALWGAWRRWRSGDRASAFLVAWFVAHALLLYAPLAFQRRLTQGLQFPLVLLTLEGLFALRHTAFRWATPRALLEGTHGRILSAFLLVFAFGMSLATVYGNELRLVLQPERHNLGSVVYLPQDELEAYAWLRRSAPRDAVSLGLNDTGLFAAGFSGRKTYVGHGVETLHFNQKREEAYWFYGRTNGVEREEFLRTRGISYVIESPRERTLNGPRLAAEPFLEPVFRGATTTVYRVLPPG